WRGALAATAGLGLVTWALTDAPKRGADAVILGAGALGAALLAAFLWIEDHAQNPMMPLGLFKSRAFLGLNALTLLLYAAFSGALFVLPFNLLRVHHYPTGAAGAALLPLSVGLAALSPLSGRLAGRIGARFMLLAGGLLAAAGFGLLALRARDGAYWTGAFPGLAVLALGMGVAVAPLTNAVLGAVSQEREGAASGVNNAVARVAGLIAVALAGFVLNGADPASIAAGYRLAMALAAGGAIGAGAIGFLTAGKRTSAR
ncbi:MAG TPA: MFS transporter, partial [Caulobacteraceae bacterium]|nr:MFS transporter [Caulobacteraceae bacterium]